MKNNLINKFLILQLPQLASSLVPILSLPIFTKFLSTEDYGILAVANTYGVLFGGLSNLGLSVAFERNFFQLKKKRKSDQTDVELFNLININIEFFLKRDVFFS